MNFCNIFRNEFLELPINLSWTPVDGAEGYIITKSDGTVNTEIKIENGEAFQYPDENLTIGQTYGYSIRAYKDINESYDSQTVTFSL